HPARSTPSAGWAASPSVRASCADTDTHVHELVGGDVLGLEAGLGRLTLGGEGGNRPGRAGRAGPASSARGPASACRRCGSTAPGAVKPAALLQQVARLDPRALTVGDVPAMAT